MRIYYLAMESWSQIVYDHLRSSENTPPRRAQ
jgi:hypothetical protein